MRAQVQGQVRVRRAHFERLKLDTMQKVDLLVASRCNLISRGLVLYQQAFAESTARGARLMLAVANAFRGYHHYEWSVLKACRRAQCVPLLVQYFVLGSTFYSSNDSP